MRTKPMNTAGSEAASGDGLALSFLVGARLANTDSEASGPDVETVASRYDVNEMIDEFSVGVDWDTDVITSWATFPAPSLFDEEHHSDSLHESEPWFYMRAFLTRNIVQKYGVRRLVAGRYPPALDGFLGMAAAVRT